MLTKKPIVNSITFEDIRLEMQKFLAKPPQKEYRWIDRDRHRGLELIQRNGRSYIRVISIDRKIVNDVWIDLKSPLGGRGFIGKVIAIKSWLDLWYSPSQISFVECSAEFDCIKKAVKEFFRVHSRGDKFVYQDSEFIDLILDIIPEQILKFMRLCDYENGKQARIKRRRRSSDMNKRIDRFALVGDKLYGCESSYLEKMTKEKLPVKLGVWEFRVLLGILLIATGGLDGVHRTPKEIREKVWENDFEVRCSRVELLNAIGISSREFQSWSVEKRWEIVNRLEASLHNLACITCCFSFPSGSVKYRNLLQELDITKRGRGSPVMYRIAPVTRFFKVEFLRRFIAQTPEMRELFLGWRKMPEVRFYFWLEKRAFATVNPKNRVSTETLLKAMKWERRLKQWGRPITVREMEKIFDKFLDSFVLFSWDGDAKKGYRFVKNIEAFGEMKAKRLYHRILAVKLLKAFEEAEER